MTWNKNQYTAMAGSLLGVTAFAVSYCLFLRPLNLYSGGFTGIAQIIDALLHLLTGSLLTGTDFTGIIFWMINLPLFILAYLSIGKRFLYTSVICVTVQSLLLVLIPAPTQPVFHDYLTNIVIGGTLSGFGVGLTLSCGGSGGGLDIVGIYGAKKYTDFSVGKVGIVINSLIYLYCALRYNLDIAAYSVLFCIIAGIVTDKVHAQNIKTSVIVVSQNPEIKTYILQELQRGVTMWNAAGGYTGETTHVYMTVISKDEFPRLRQKIMALDSKAFITVQNHMNVYGNFLKRF